MLFSGRTLVVAFEGWNDAGEASSGAARFLIDVTDGKAVSEIETQDFYDFQFARPQVYLDEEGQRQLRWPNTQMYRPHLNELFNLRVLLGVEPNRNWVEFSRQVADRSEEDEIDSVIFLGSLLADVPHTRSIQVTATSTNSDVYGLPNVEKSLYEGPVGILSVLGMEFEKRGIPTMSLWASVPHYVQHGSSPKATLALVTELEKFLGIQFEHGDLASEAFKWERSLDELTDSDEDLAEYVESLEKTRDEIDGADGDIIAREVEQFLRDSEDGN